MYSAEFSGLPSGAKEKYPLKATRFRDVEKETRMNFVTGNSGFRCRRSLFYHSLEICKRMPAYREE
jgi:hypothetical protein